MTGSGIARRLIGVGGLAALLGLTGGALESVGGGSGGFRLVTPAEARVVVRHTAIYVYTLPPGCVRTTFGSVVVWRCGNRYYQPYKGRYVVVTVTNE